MRNCLKRHEALSHGNAMRHRTGMATQRKTRQRRRSTRAPPHGRAGFGTAALRRWKRTGPDGCPHRDKTSRRDRPRARSASCLAIRRKKDACGSLADASGGHGTRTRNPIKGRRISNAVASHSPTLLDVPIFTNRYPSDKADRLRQQAADCCGRELHRAARQPTAAGVSQRFGEPARGSASGAAICSS